MNLSPLLISFQVAIPASLITFLLGIWAAYRVAGMKRWQTLIDGLLTLPMVLPPTVVGYFLLLIFGKNGLLGGFLLGVGRLPVPWQALLLSIGIYVALPLVAGYFSRKWIIQSKGETWFKEKFLHVLTPITIIALLTILRRKWKA